MHSIPSKDLSEREVELLQRVKSLEKALRTTLDYQSELQPKPPANIAAFRDLLAKPRSDSTIAFDVTAEFLDLITSMARFLSNSSAMDVFSSKGTTGFADWVILATLATQPPGSLTDRQLTRFIGASIKRTRRQLSTLSNSGLILLSPGREAEAFYIQITPAGQARVAEIEAELLPLLKSFVTRNPLQFLFPVARIRALSRIHDRAAHREAPEDA